MGITTNVRCAFYNMSTKQWKDDGCATERVLVNGTWVVHCSCDHMTSFAVLMVN